MLGYEVASLGKALQTSEDDALLQELWTSFNQ